MATLAKSRVKVDITDLLFLTNLVEFMFLRFADVVGSDDEDDEDDIEPEQEQGPDESPRVSNYPRKSFSIDSLLFSKERSLPRS